jgi:hypothetical protein
MTAPVAPSWLSKLLFIVAAFLFLLAAVTVSGGDIFRADASAWFYGALAALALGLAAS